MTQTLTKNELTRTGWLLHSGLTAEDLGEQVDVCELLQNGWFFECERDCLKDQVAYGNLTETEAELEELNLRLVEVALARNTFMVKEATLRLDCFEAGKPVFDLEVNYELTL